MSATKWQSISVGYASLVCAALMVSSAGYAQEVPTNVDTRLQQLAQLEKSGLYSDEEIADARKKILEPKQTDLERRLQQLEQLRQSGNYSEEEIADAKKRLLDSVVTPAPTAEQFVEMLGTPGAYSRRMENPLYSDYVERLADRHDRALELRREYAYSKPPARGWLAIRIPYDANTLANFIERGWVAQPPIPRPQRRVVVVPPDDPYDEYEYPIYPPRL